jgi:hypothetical protein
MTTSITPPRIRPRARVAAKPNGEALAEPEVSTPEPAPDPPPCVHVSPAETDAHAAALVRERQCAIIRACCDQAEAGSYLHAKFVFDFAGIAPALRDESAAAAAADARERSLAEELLTRLDDHEFLRQLSAAGRAHPIK